MAPSAWSAAYLHWEVKVEHGQPAWLAWLVGLTGCALIGALSHLLIMRQLRRASPSLASSPPWDCS